MTQNGQPRKRRSRGVCPRTSSKIRMGNTNFRNRPYESTIQLGTQEPQILEEKPTVTKSRQRRSTTTEVAATCNPPKKKKDLLIWTEITFLLPTSSTIHQEKKDQRMSGLWNHGRSRRHERLLNKNGGVANAWIRPHHSSTPLK